MIRFANIDTAPLVRRMWQTCFDDTDEFMDILFSRQYRHENTLLYFEGHEPVASLQMIPYTISFYGEIVSFYYLAGLCTLPAYRGRGYMGQLIQQSLAVMQERTIPLTILVPAEESLMGYYKRFGFEQVFEQNDKSLPSIKKILNETASLEEAYKQFEAIFNHHSLCVQKDFNQFQAIVEDARMDNFPEKHNLSAMARIIDAPYLTRLYERANSLSIDRNVDRQLMCRLLFGYKIDELPKEYRTFPSQHPIINLMLE